MSQHVILQQNKLIIHIKLSSQLLQSHSDPFLHLNQLVLIAYHFQYPCVFYEKIYNHYKNFLQPKSIKKQQIRLEYEGKELASDLPIGLFLQKSSNSISVKISEFQIADPYKIVKQSWKKAFSAINSNKGCYYIYKQLGQTQLRLRLQKYFCGQPHNFQNQSFEGYQGNNIICRFFIDGQIVERKTEVGDKTVGQLIEQQVPEVIRDGRQWRVKTHRVEVDQEMPAKQFLDEWSYNDGFCYLKIEWI